MLSRDSGHTSPELAAEPAQRGSRSTCPPGQPVDGSGSYPVVVGVVVGEAELTVEGAGG
jgi:hypothetical protein